MADTDLRKFFDPSRLDERSLGMIEFVLNSPAYEEAFKPYLETVRDGMQRKWLDRSQSRKDEYPDDFLAGGVCAIEGLLQVFTFFLKQTSMDRIHDSMEGMTSERQYEMRRQQGRVSPVVGVDQPTLPAKYDPAEDF